MEKPTHDMSSLFAQLGLPNSEAEITAFVTKHSPLSAKVSLADAPFWSDSQAAFLREELKEDADWAAVVDDLNARLRG